MTPSNSHDGAPAPPDDGAGGSGPTSAATRRDLWNGLDQSSIMSVEFIAAILVWGGIGFGLDRWLGTRPWLMGIGVLVGFGAGLYLIWLRSSKDQHYPNGAARAHRTPDTSEKTSGQ